MMLGKSRQVTCILCGREWKIGKRGKGTIEVTEQDNEIFLVTMRTVNVTLVNTQLQGIKVTETQSCLN